MNALTLNDLLSADSNGFGYLGNSCRRPETYAEMPSPHIEAYLCDVALVETANELQLNVAQFAEFLDSRVGRHLGDALTGERTQHGRMAAALEAMRAYFLADAR